MARTARLKSCTGIYHVMMRGSNRQNIFIDDMDRSKFLSFVKSATNNPLSISGKQECVCKVYAYALMGNHFHMLVDVKSGHLGEFVKKIAASYVGYFNRKYNREGHLFKERFKSEPCETENYFSILLSYIHQNPIKHGFAEQLDEYPHTSWGEYVDPKNAKVNVCDTGYVLGKMSLQDFKDVVYSRFNYNDKCIDIDITRGQLPDEYIVKYLNDKYGIQDPLEIKGYERQKRSDLIVDLLEYGGAVRQLEKITGVNKMAISRLKNEQC